jgi:hypothetical protein
VTSRLPEGYWINPYKTTFDKLSEVCGFDTRKALVEFGAKKLEIRQNILRESGTREKKTYVLYLKRVIFGCQYLHSQ